MVVEKDTKFDWTSKVTPFDMIMLALALPDWKTGEQLTLRMRLVKVVPAPRSENDGVMPVVTTHCSCIVVLVKPLNLARMEMVPRVDTDNTVLLLLMRMPPHVFSMTCSYASVSR